jgi:hypothetical protein
MTTQVTAPQAIQLEVLKCVYLHRIISTSFFPVSCAVKALVAKEITKLFFKVAIWRAGVTVDAVDVTFITK